MFEIVVALAVGYLLGSFPSAVLVARVQQKDIFEIGSGNMGTMNVARNLGYGWGVLVLLMDMGKGALAVYIALLMGSATGQPDLLVLWMALAASVGAVMGHAYSAFVRFRGGKALATALGTALPIYPIAGLLALGILVALILIVRRVNLASVLTGLAYPFIVMFRLVRAGETQDVVFSVFTALVVLALIIIIKHIPSLRKGEKATFLERFNLKK